MTADDVKKLRDELSCTTRELAATIGVEQETILAWERGELFPTKRFVVKMEELRRKGKTAIARKPRGPLRGTAQTKTPAPPAAMATTMDVLADPEMWKLVRKLLAHADLRRDVTKLAETYPDPARDPAEKEELAR